LTEYTRPYLLVDVDGVLNAITTSAERGRLIYKEGWVHKWAELPIGRFRLLCNPACGPLLTRLAADTGAELAWGTTWEDDANTWVGPLVGLPVLPVAPVSGYRSKADGVVPWTNGRPFVWFDDQLSVALRTAELAADRPHLVVETDPSVGLTAEHIGIAREWLLALGSRPVSAEIPDVALAAEGEASRG